MSTQRLVDDPTRKRLVSRRPLLPASLPTDIGLVTKIVNMHEKAEGLDGHTFQPVATTDFFMGLRPAGERWHEHSPLFPSLRTALPFVDELERRKAAGYPIQNSEHDFRKFRSYFTDPVRFGKLESCESELNSVLVTHDGHVKMCPNTRESFGHVLEHGLDALWASRAAERARRHVYQCTSQCKILANTKDDFYF